MAVAGPSNALDWATFVVNIPALNGDIEAGIALGVDQSVPEADRLPILKEGDVVSAVEVVQKNAAVWALRLCERKGWPDAARTLFLNGVVVVISGRLMKLRLSGDANIPDGDWAYTHTKSTPREGDKDIIQTTVTIENMRVAVALIMATKANFWVMNHHTGTGAAMGYVKKMVDTFYPEKSSPSESIVAVVYMLGHYVSTRFVLTRAEVPGIAPVVDVPGLGAASWNLIFSKDATLRFASLPAGTHRCAVSYEGAKRLVRSVYAPVCPMITEFATIAEAHAAILKNRAGHHIGASYLTGAPRVNYNDNDMEAYMGRIGAYILAVASNSTLAKSPHFKREKVESYEDYDKQFQTDLGNLLRESRDTRVELIDRVKSRIQSPTDAEIEQTKAVFV